MSNIYKYMRWICFMCLNLLCLHSAFHDFVCKVFLVELAGYVVWLMHTDNQFDSYREENYFLSAYWHDSQLWLPNRSISGAFGRNHHVWVLSRLSVVYVESRWKDLSLEVPPVGRWNFYATELRTADPKDVLLFWSKNI